MNMKNGQHEVHIDLRSYIELETACFSSEIKKQPSSDLIE